MLSLTTSTGWRGLMNCYYSNMAKIDGLSSYAHCDARPTPLILYEALAKAKPVTEMFTEKQI